MAGYRFQNFGRGGFERREVPLFHEPIDYSRQFRSGNGSASAPNQTNCLNDAPAPAAVTCSHY